MNSKLILACLFVLFQSQLLAHNPNQASIKLIIQEKGAFIDLNMSQFGIEQVLLKDNPNLDLSVIDKTELKELIINKVKGAIRITSNGNKFDLGTGVIKLGNHETNLKFLVNDLPQNIEYLDIKANCLQENENQVNFFTVLYKDKDARAKLYKENNYQSKFILTQDEIMVSENLINNNWNRSKIFTMLLLLCSLIGYILVQKRINIDKTESINHSR